MVFEDYKEMVGTAAGVVTIGQMFSGVLVCKDIYKAGTTKAVPPMTFIAGFVLTILFLQHGILLEDHAMSIVNYTGLAINTSYIIFYYLYTSDEEKPDFHSQMLKACTVAAIMLGYAQWESPEHAEYRFGMMLTAIMMIFIAFPLFSLGDIIKTGNTDSIAMPMVASGWVVSAHWLLYGIIIMNDAVIIQNAVALLLCSIQIALVVKYRYMKGTNKNKTQ